MSLANDLLNSITVEEDDKTLVINHYTRSINIPKGITTLGVESDDDVLRLNFKMPRYLGTVDLYNFSIRVNYINAEGEDDVYKVTDKAVVGNNVTFSWLVGPTAVAYKGVTKFNVSLIITDSNSVIKQEYNTAIASLPVLEGMETSERVVSEYTDILEQWERRLFGISDTEEAKLLAFSEEQQTNIAEKGAEVLATIPEDYQTTYKLANEGTRTKADAIICSAEGETIIVSDSSDDYLRGLKVFGKTTQVKTTGAQLAYFADGIRQGVSGVNARVERGIITLYGSITNSTVVYPISVFSEPVDLSLMSVGDILYANSCKLEYTKAGETKYGNVVTYTDDITYMRAYVQRSQSEYVNGEIVYPMLSKVQNAPFEQYSGGVATPSPSYPQELTSITDLTVSAYSNNLFPIINTTAYNIIATPQVDGSIAYKGTSDGNAWHVYQNCPLPLTGPYRLTVHTSKPTKKGFLVQLFNRDNVIVKTWISVEADHVAVFDGESGGILRWNIGVEPGEVVDTNVKLMVSIGETALPWEPYAGVQNVEVKHTLPGIPVTSGGNYTDSDGRQWICDEIDFERGVYVQRVYALVSDYSSGWKISGNSTTNYNAFYRINTSLPTMIKGTNNPVICTHFTTTRDPVADHTICVSGGLSNQEVYFFVPKSEFPDVETWTNYVLQQSTDGTPITTYYILATPIETPLTADELAAFQALKTNYPNTTVLNDSGVWMSLRYNADTKTWINNLIDEKITAAVANL